MHIHTPTTSSSGGHVCDYGSSTAAAAARLPEDGGEHDYHLSALTHTCTYMCIRMCATAVRVTENSMRKLRSLRQPRKHRSVYFHVAAFANFSRRVGDIPPVYECLCLCLCICTLVVVGTIRARSAHWKLTRATEERQKTCTQNARADSSTTLPINGHRRSVQRGSLNQGRTSACRTRTPGELFGCLYLRAVELVRYPEQKK